MHHMETHQHQKAKKSGGRGTETLFRVTFHNQINLIQIADNKASMIITLNTLIITILIGLSGYGATIPGNLFRSANIIIPVVLLILTCLLSVIFSIRAAQPKIIRSRKKPLPGPKQKSSLLFFSTFSEKTLEEYMKEMDELISSKASIYHNLEIDIYNQGRVLNRKYKLLGISYRIFMYGFVASVLAFLVILLFSTPIF